MFEPENPLSKNAITCACPISLNEKSQGQYFGNGQQKQEIVLLIQE
jgi:hypothetical protein